MNASTCSGSQAAEHQNSLGTTYGAFCILARTTARTSGAAPVDQSSHRFNLLDQDHGPGTLGTCPRLLVVRRGFSDAIEGGAPVLGVGDAVVSSLGPLLESSLD